jgi:bacterioferritin
MKGHDKVIEILNELLTNELTAINQYFIHAKMCEDWGYAALAAKLREESIDEMRHADQVITRILYLDGMPNIQRYNKISVGENVPEQFSVDLELEKAAIKFLNEGIATCSELGDIGTRELLSGILVSEEAHIDWIEEQVGLIEQVGVQNYLAQQIRL